MKELIILSFLLLTSCSTIIPKNSNKSFRNKWTNDIVWNKKIYRPGMFVHTYKDVDSMFVDSPETQAQIKKANALTQKSSIFLWGGVVAAITYIFATDPSNLTTYYSILAAGLLPSMYFSTSRHKTIDNALEEYNKKKGFTFSPIIGRDENLGGKLSAIFTF